MHAVILMAAVKLSPHQAFGYWAVEVIHHVLSGNTKRVATPSNCLSGQVGVNLSARYAAYITNTGVLRKRQLKVLQSVVYLVTPRFGVFGCSLQVANDGVN